MRPVTVYTDEICTLCHSVENLLNVREIPYEKVIVTEGSDEHQQLAERSGMTSLPQ
jgi:glutaredoxin